MDFLVAQLTTTLTTKLTTDNQPKDRDVAAAALLGKIGPAAVGKLMELLDHPRPRTRALAARALAEIGPAANGAVPRLIDLLEDRASQLGATEWLHKGWLPDDSYYYRAPTPGSFGAGGRDLIDVRDLAIFALGSIGPESRSAVSRLARLLEAPLADETGYRAFHRSLAAWTLGQIGPDASSAIPALIRLAKRDQERPEGIAAVALARIDPENPAVIECLERYLAEGEHRGFFDDDGSSDVILEDVLDVVWELGSRGDPLRADLRRLLASPLLHLSNRCCAAYALASFPAERPAAVRYLERMAAHGDSGDTDWFLEQIEAFENQGR